MVIKVEISNIICTFWDFVCPTLSNLSRGFGCQHLGPFEDWEVHMFLCIIESMLTLLKLLNPSRATFHRYLSHLGYIWRWRHLLLLKAFFFSSFVAANSGNVLSQYFYKMHFILTFWLCVFGAICYCHMMFMPFVIGFGWIEGWVSWTHLLCICLCVF